MVTGGITFPHKRIHESQRITLHKTRSSIIADKRKCVEDLATKADKDAREGNMKQLYDTTKELVGKYSKPDRLVKDKRGERITEIPKQWNRWVERLEELLNAPAPLDPPGMEAAPADLPTDVTEQRSRRSRWSSGKSRAEK
ncbi:unnamed protein product [Schistosoma curassoni]|uniref:Transposase n=1 Tax=Schistosoma curassoni TaxID=6186 RepID=A0A183JLE6_9TREM|nr:unnamed protein product [Schistosoma curassoni]